MTTPDGTSLHDFNKAIIDEFHANVRVMIADLERGMRALRAA